MLDNVYIYLFHLNAFSIFYRKINKASNLKMLLLSNKNYDYLKKLTYLFLKCIESLILLLHVHIYQTDCLYIFLSKFVYI